MKYCNLLIILSILSLRNFNYQMLFKLGNKRLILSHHHIKYLKLLNKEIQSLGDIVEKVFFNSNIQNSLNPFLYSLLQSGVIHENYGRLTFLLSRKQ